MLADTDAGNVVTAAQAGAQWGYRLLPLCFVLAPALYIMQQLTVRLGVFTGRGFIELVRDRFGLGWAWIVVVGVAIATVSSILTELAAVAGVGEMYGLSRSFTLLLACAFLLFFVRGKKHRRIERTAMFVGVLEFAFFTVAWAAAPAPTNVINHLSQTPLQNSAFSYMAPAVIGASFNPWMIVYQQSSVAEKRLSKSHYKYACWETAVGAIITQALSGAALVGIASTVGESARTAGLQSIAEISFALEPALGVHVGRLIFGFAVLGAAMVAAIVASLALFMGVGQLDGFCPASNDTLRTSRRFNVIYGAGLAGSAALVFFARDLVWLNIAAQVINVSLLPIFLILLFFLSSQALPEAKHFRGSYRMIVGFFFCLISVVSWIGLLSKM
jgi:Mn2+/Fe2+ NRAMP family transporter